MKTPSIGSRETRSFTVNRDAINGEARTIELSFSSEAEYERSWGIEILSHDAGAVDLGRLNNGGALLVNHSVDDQVGVVESAVIGADRKGRAVVRFGKSDRASDIFNDVTDGIRTLVSVGYEIDELTLVEKRGDQSVYRVTKWTPFEVSIVSIPADASVGVGRAADVDPEPTTGDDLEPEIVADEPEQAAEEIGTTSEPEEVAVNTPIEVKSIMTNENDAVLADRERAKNIRAMGETLNCRELATMAIDDGLTVEQFMSEYRSKVPAAKPIDPMKDVIVGLTDKESRSFNWGAWIDALAFPNDVTAQRRAAFELEASAEAARLLTKAGGNVRGNGVIPLDVMKLSRRDLTVSNSGGSTGGVMVPTNLDTNLIEYLRNQTVVAQMGARFMTGMSANFNLSRQSGGATAYSFAEGGAPTDSRPSFDVVSFTPKGIGAQTTVSRQLLTQADGIQSIVERELLDVMALYIDTMALSGSGTSNQPTGLLNTSGISTVSNTNGTAASYANVVALEGTLANANAAKGKLGYLTSPKVKAKMKVTEMFTGTNGMPVWGFDGTVNGYTAVASGQIASGVTKGTATNGTGPLIFGNWDDLIIAEFGQLQLQVDPYSGSSTGAIKVVVLDLIDVGVRHPASFAVISDALHV